MTDQADSRHATGMQTRRSVLGDAHVDRAEAAKTAFDAPFQELITEAAWGHVWSRPDWTKRERSIVTIALLAALGQDEEVAMHVRATAQHRRDARRHPRGAAARRDLRRRAGREPRVQDRQADLQGDGGGAMTAEFFQRDRTLHPPALTPDYKTSVTRSPRYALLSLQNSLSEITGPMFGHADLGPLDNDLILNYAHGRRADRRAHRRARPRARRERRGRCRTRWSSSGRPTPAAATATRRTPTSRRSTRTSAAAAGR